MGHNIIFRSAKFVGLCLASALAMHNWQELRPVMADVRCYAFPGRNLITNGIVPIHSIQYASAFRLTQTKACQSRTGLQTRRKNRPGMRM